MESRHSLLFYVGITIAFVVLGVSVYMYITGQSKEVVIEEPVVIEDPVVTDPRVSLIGNSVEGRPIESYTFGNGDRGLLFVGGIHGGYEWNSVLLAYRFIDYFTEDPARIPNDFTLTVVPSANPDGLYAVIQKEGRFSAGDVLVDTSDGTGRFNANGVDLNRNFDCKWQAESSWRGNTVSAGDAVFSEPEAVAIRNLVSEIKPEAALFWHSQANNVYASECENGVLPETIDIMNAYADAAGYGAVPSFDAYPVTGDVEGWLASIGVPAITVELETHETVEWERNLAGVKALFKYQLAK